MCILSEGVNGNVMQILRPVYVINSVTFTIPSTDRGSGDQGNLVCVVLEYEQTNDQCKICSKDGIINGSVSRNLFTFSSIVGFARYTYHCRVKC